MTKSTKNPPPRKTTRKPDVGTTESSVRRGSAADHHQRKSKTNQSANTPPPVMVRGYRMDVPFQGKASYARKVRRRIDLPLNIPGAEMRLPSLPTWRAVSRWIAIGLVAAFVGLLYFLWNAPFFRVGAAQVEGVSRINPGDVNAVLGISGKPIFTLRSAKLEKELQAAFPEFSDVELSVNLPNIVKVTAAERVPVLTWRQGDTLQLIDQAGYAFPMRMSATTLVAPVIEAAGSPPGQGLATLDTAALVAESIALAAEDGEEADATAADAQSTTPEPFLKPEMVSAIQTLSKTLPTEVAIIYDPEHGFGWQDEGGWQVYLGDDQNMEIKLKVYASIVERLIDEEVQPALISVEHIHNPYFRVQESN